MVDHATLVSRGFVPETPEMAQCDNTHLFALNEDGTVYVHPCSKCEPVSKDTA